ncbi:MAG TPA: hypothetical protein VK464_26525 [Symbiobacteriaceae bacterium]|nr:hypothetical protein [Symbiobacteriaceae bacterium]
MRKGIGLLVTLALVLVMAVPGFAGNTATKRVYISGSAEALAAAKAQGAAPIFGFPDGFSAELSDAAINRLSAIQGLNIEMVGTMHVLGQPVGVSGTKGKPGGDRTAFPEDPTPWGIESLYSNQSITSTSGGASG